MAKNALKKIRIRTYNSLSTKQKETFKNATPRRYERNVSSPLHSEAEPYSNEYVEQSQAIDELFKITENAQNFARTTNNNNLYAYSYSSNRPILLKFSDFTVAPIMGMDNNVILNFAKNQYKVLNSTIEESLKNTYRQPFKNELIKSQKAWLKNKISNADFHKIFDYYIEEVNNNDSYSGRTGWTEEPFFQIIALNEFMNHTGDEEMTLGEYSDKNFDTLYNLLMSHNYTSYSYTKKFLEKFTFSYETPLLVYTHKSSKEDRELIKSLTKEQIFILHNNLETLTSKTVSVFHKIQAVLEPENTMTIASESDLAKMTARILAEKIINDEYNHSRDMYTLMSSCHSITKNTLSTLSYEKSDVTKNSVFYLRIYDLIKIIDDNKDKLNTRQVIGFILSLNSNYRRMAAADGSLGDYIVFLETISETKDSLSAAYFFGMLGEALLSKEKVPTIEQWSNYAKDEEDFTIPLSMLINIITDSTNTIQRNAPKELNAVRNSLPA